MFIEIAENDYIDTNELKRYYIHQYLNTHDWCLTLFWKHSDNYSQIEYETEEEAKQALRKINAAVANKSSAPTIIEEWV